MTAAQVKTLRQRLALTQEQFAHELKVTFSTVSRWENGHVAPSKLAVMALQRLAEVRGVEFPRD